MSTFIIIMSIVNILLWGWLSTQTEDKIGKLACWVIVFNMFIDIIQQLLK
jgi:hypothetical protein